MTAMSVDSWSKLAAVCSNRSAEGIGRSLVCLRQQSCSSLAARP